MKKKLPWSEAQFNGACRIVEDLRRRGYEALFAGGCVRDLLLERLSPDIDIATSATPETVLHLFPRVIPVGLKYGVVCVLVDEFSYEVTTFRTDFDYQDHRHPSRVEFTDARTDAQRRDFTINGLFYDPILDRILDYVAGQEDIRLRCIRAIGHPADRFAEDYLRMLRALRFACTLGFRIESDTMKAIRAGAREILHVSWERIRDEVKKMLTGPQPAQALDLLAESGLLDWILPEVAAMRGVEQPAEFHPEGDVYTHTRNMLGHLHHPSFTLAMGVLLHDVGKPPTFHVADRIRFDQHVEVGATLAEAICQRLRLSNEETGRILDLVRQHMRFMPVQEMRPSTLKRFLRQEHFEEHLELHRIDCLGSHGDLSNWDFCRARLDEMKTEEIRPKRLLGGDDLIQLGYRPGPLFQRILLALEDAQLEGQVSDRSQALSWVAGHFPLDKEPS